MIYLTHSLSHSLLLGLRILLPLPLMVFYVNTEFTHVYFIKIKTVKRFFI